MDLEHKTELNKTDETAAENADKSNGNEEIKTITWLNKKYFEKYLQKQVENFAKIQSFSVSMASKMGENYTSTLYRIHLEIELVNLTRQKLAYIVKIPIPGAESDSFAVMMHLYTKEIVIYDQILPRFEQLYRDQGIHMEFGPKYIKPSDIFDDVPDIESILILEDLSARGFNLQDRLEGLSMQYTEKSLQKLAEFHAVSARYVEVYGAYEKMFDVHMITEETRPLYANANIDFFYNFAKQYKGYEEYRDKLPPILKNFVDLSIAACNTDPTEFNVLNHGDFWTNNIMFNQDGENAQLETSLIDFQLCKYGSPMLDLYMFLLSCPQLEIKIQHFDYFIKHYHDHLIKNLKNLKYEGKIPTLKDLHISLLKYGIIAFMVIITCLPAVIWEPVDVNEATFDVFLLADTPETEPIRKSMFLSERFKAHADVIMPWLANRGLLE